MRCRAGDMAIVVQAQNSSNIGLIVKVVENHDGSGEWVMRDKGHMWLVEANTPMLWTLGPKEFVSQSGPVPDCYLQPIRDDLRGIEVTVRVLECEVL